MRWLKALRVKEEGNSSFIAMLLLLPLLCGVFGVAMDYAYANYVRTSLQESLDKSTLYAAQQMTDKTGQTEQVDKTAIRHNVFVSMDQEKAKANVQQEYSKSRKNFNQVLTSTGNISTDWSLNDAQGRLLLPTIHSSTTESSKTFFMSMLGVDEITYHLESSARIGNISE